MWRLLYDSAARAEEALGLDVPDLDLANLQARARTKGGHVRPLHFQTAAARLLARLTAGRQPGRCSSGVNGAVSGCGRPVARVCARHQPMLEPLGEAVADTAEQISGRLGVPPAGLTSPAEVRRLGPLGPAPSCS